MTIKIGDIVLEIPQHDKLEELKGEYNAVGMFFEWLKERYCLALWGEDDEWDAETLYPVYPRTYEVLAEYYEIDLRAFWKEKDAILSAYRKQQEAIDALDN